MASIRNPGASSIETTPTLVAYVSLFEARGERFRVLQKFCGP